MRFTRIGLGLCLASLLPQLALAFPARFGLSPDNSEELLMSVFGSAQQSLTMNIYEFKSTPILKAVLGRIKAGVDVRILLEGQPDGTMTPGQQSVINQLKAAMTQSGNPRDLFYVMTNRNGGKRRYAFDHAKYMVIDQKRVMISSENFAPTTFVTAGKTGNRGWHAVLESPAFASQMLALFAVDADLSQGDLVDMLTDSTTFNVKKTKEVPQHAREAAALPITAGNVTKATLVTSPNSLPAIQAFIESAQSSVDFEYASLPPSWSKPAKHQNPIIDSLLAAARRHVRVRVLLNDDSVFAKAGAPTPANPLPPLEEGPSDARDQALDPSAARSAPLPNVVTVKLLQDLASVEHLPLEARIVNVTTVGITYIHNKGIIADGVRAFVSSINGTQNSVTNNREVAVTLESRDAATYFGQAFGFDWDESAPHSTPWMMLSQPLVGLSRVIF